MTRVSASDTVTNLLSSQDDGGQLRAVAPLCQEGEGEGLDEDGRDEAVPLFRRNRRPRPSLHIWGSVHLFGSLELQRRRKVVTNRNMQNLFNSTIIFLLCTVSGNTYNMKSASASISVQGAETQSAKLIISIYDSRLVFPLMS